MGLIIYGPYKRRDGREIVVFYDQSTGRTTSMSYPKYLMGAPDGSEVHHKDEDRTNNDVSNLEVLSHNEHVRRHTKDPTTIEISCDNCGNTAFKLKKNVKMSRKLDKKLYCGRKCACIAAGKASEIARRKGV